MGETVPYPSLEGVPCGGGSLCTCPVAGPEVNTMPAFPQGVLVEDGARDRGDRARARYEPGLLFCQGFPCSSVGKESACTAGNPGLILGLGRSAGEGIDNPLQSSWASLMVQLVKKSACHVGDLGSIPGLGRPPGEGKGYHSSMLAWRIPWTIQSTGLQRVRHLSLFRFSLSLSLLPTPPYQRQGQIQPGFDPRVHSLLTQQ